MTSILTTFLTTFYIKTTAKIVFYRHLTQLDEMVEGSHKPHKINEKSTSQREVLSIVLVMRVTGLEPARSPTRT